MAGKLLSALLILVGLIHLLPLAGILGAERLATLYGLDFQEPNLLLLMRSRALLFGLLGALLIHAAWHPSVQPLALLGGLVSVAGFLALAAGGTYNEALRRVVLVDWVALACLILALVLYLTGRRSG